MKSVYVTLIVALTQASLPALGQYHYNYGGSRVVNQGQTGLSNPSSTYIGAGTMSQSARGLPAGMSSGGLPQTKMGGAVGTPGDNQYTDAVQYERRFGHPHRVLRNNQYYNQQPQQPQGHFYVPGQNGGAVQQGQFVSPRNGRNFGQGGTANYAETEQYNVNNNGAFHY
jgi:hypothetical protein